MNPTKVARNPGLSNSVATVLGEGGAMLGALCMMPFLICFLYLFRREEKGERDMALWAVGPLGLYVGIIFVYHIFLIFVIAFGYSLVEVRHTEGEGLPRRLALTNLWRDDAPESGDVRRQRKRALAHTGAWLLAGALFVWLGVPVCNAVQRFLRVHQFSMSQSPEVLNLSLGELP